MKAPVFPALRLVERVSLDWLWTGLGAPYVVDHCNTDEEFVRRIEELPQGQKICALTCESELVLVFHKESQHDLGSYREVHILSGQPGELTEKLLFGVLIKRTYVKTRLFNAIRNGYANNEEVLKQVDEDDTILVLDEWLHGAREYENILLDTVRKLDEKQKNMISEVAKSYFTGNK